MKKLALVLSLLFALPVYASREFSGDLANALTAANVVTAEPFSVSLWVRLKTLPSTGGTQGPFAFSRSDDNILYNFSLRITDTADQACWWKRFGGGVFDACTTTSLVAINTWYHICVKAVTDSDRQSLLDGAGKATNTQTVSIMTLANTNIGRTVAAYQPMDGWIAEVAVYNRELTDAECVELTTKKPSEVDSASHAAYWSFETTSLADESGNGFTLTEVGTVPWSAEHPPIGAPEPPKVPPFIYITDEVHN